jgi:hypothetical protein
VIDRSDTTLGIDHLTVRPAADSTVVASSPDDVAPGTATVERSRTRAGSDDRRPDGGHKEELAPATRPVLIQRLAGD